MNAKISLLVALVLSTWGAVLLVATGLAPLPTFLEGMELPTTLAGLGDALAITDGIFTTMAITLGLIAILLQGRELKASTDANAEQAKALWLQMKQTQEANRLNAMTARLQFLSSDNERLERQVARLRNQIAELGEPESDQDGGAKRTELWDILKASDDRRRRQVEQARLISTEVEKLTV
jgi:hypothetical protein